MIDKIDGSSGFGSTMSSQTLNDTQKLQSQNGEAKEMKSNDKPTMQGMSEDEFKQKAQSMGVPENVIQQGMQAVKSWVMENKDTDSSESLINITV